MVTSIPGFRRILSRHDLAPLTRHAALLAAALLAWLLRDEFRTGGPLLWLIFGLAGLNLAVFLIPESRPSNLVVQRASTLLAVLGWVGLAHLTGGVRSPFVAGIWFELILAGLPSSNFPPAFLVAYSTVLLWLQQSLLGTGNALTILCVDSAFLSLTGLGVWQLRKSWTQSGNERDESVRRLVKRLADLEQEMEDLKAVGHLGTRAARVAHGVVNAVHSLKGFVELMEAECSDSSRQFLDGIRLVTDRLEELSRAALDAPGDRRGTPGLTPCAELPELVRKIVSETPGPFRNRRWSVDVAKGGGAVGLGSHSLKEVLEILLRNAVEATRDGEAIEVKSRFHQECYEIVVRDHGCGLSDDRARQLFRPATTSKPGGHGFGLFLARSLVEAGGGRLEVRSPDGAGTAFAVQIPVHHESADATIAAGC